MLGGVKRQTQVYWRMGWVLVGLIGLISLTLMPPAKPTVDPDPPKPEEWVEALWQVQPESVDKLLASGGDPNALLDELGTRPLHALFAGPGCQTPEQLLEVLERLISRGARINAVDERGNSPLTLAAGRCGTPVIKGLLAAGADSSHRNLRGLTALEMTLTAPGHGIDALLQAGLRLAPGQAREYRRIYADEPAILLRIERATQPVEAQ
jgi:hypothetical protein